MDSAAEGIVTLDFEWRVLTFNPAAESIFKIRSNEVVARPFVDLIYELEPSVLAEFMNSDSHRLEPTEFATEIDGQRVVIEITISKTVGDDSSSMIVIVRDRTKSKMLESKLAISQKMESIGQLSAGIAHEINSPMQYVSDNTRFLKDAFTDIDAILQKYDELVQCCKSNGDSKPIIDSIEDEYVEADLEFTLEEVPLAIDQTIVGAERVSKIVHAMKVFSHPGETQGTGFDLNDAVQSTVNVSKNEWKYAAELEVDLQEDLPEFYGFPSKLNQALLNLVVNGAHAILNRIEEEPDHKGLIRISTRCMGESIEIKVTDNGCGISEENIPRIFDPFFTTKPVGKGTGQGMSITHSIVVETHGGSIELQSKRGVGTTFTLQLPIIIPETASRSLVCEKV